MPIPRSPEDDLADARELSYAGAMGFSIWDEKVYSISSQPLFVGKNVKAYRYEHCNEFDKAEELYLENIAEGSSLSHCYERLAIMYRKQKRYDDEVAILEKHLVLDESDKQKLSERLIKAKQLKQGVRIVKTKVDRIEAAKKRMAEIKDTIKAYNVDTLRGYKDSGVVTGVEILCADDNRTCAACKELSGKRFSFEEAPMLPYEKCSSDSCRCTYIAVIKDEYKL
jgi:SPP1 gp7 family putative phage head morphogenesis protein